MAGFFADVPGMRFAYDRDGSIVLRDGSVTPSAGAVAQMNSERGTAIGEISYDDSIGVAWPEVRSVAGIFIAGQTWTDVVHTYWSPDTTNVADGTWTFLMDIPIPNLGVVGSGGGMGAYCRTHITPITGVTAARGVKFFLHAVNEIAVALHVYGQTPLTENPDRLVLCDASGAVVTNGAYFDFGDSPRATTATKTFRIRNNSAALTANSVTLSFQQLWDASPTLAGQFQYDVGAGWVNTASIGSLAPGSTSGVISVRRNTSATAAGGPWQSRVVAVPASMT